MPTRMLVVVLLIAARMPSDPRCRADPNRGRAAGRCADPVDLITRRSKNETAQDRVAMYQSELAAESRPAMQAVLLHGSQPTKKARCTKTGKRLRAPMPRLRGVEAGLRSNLWALRRLAVRRRDWQELLWPDRCGDPSRDHPS